jgi:hypothetical protein
MLAPSVQTHDFIEVYPGALSPAACAALLARFEASSMQVPGRIGSGVRPELKHSRDIWMSTDPVWRDAEQELNEAMFRGLLQYVRKYPYVLLAPLMFQWPDENGNPRPMRAEDIAGFNDEILGDIVRTALRPGAINLQRYTAGEGGFPYWHCEASPSDPTAEHLHRALLWTIYLNDGFEEGETEFYFQDRKIVPQAGALLLAPTAFTHTHRGNKPLKRDKYIATSWVLYKRAEQLFGAKK